MCDIADIADIADTGRLRENAGGEPLTLFETGTENPAPAGPSAHEILAGFYTRTAREVLDLFAESGHLEEMLEEAREQGRAEARRELRPPEDETMSYGPPTWDIDNAWTGEWRRDSTETG